MEMMVRVARWGTSLAVRLPKKLVAELQLKEGDEVSVIADTKQLVKMKRGGTASEAIARMAARKWTLPEGYGFDRNEANAR